VRYVIRFPDASGGLQYLGGGGQLEPDPMLARKFPTREAGETFAGGYAGGQGAGCAGLAWWLLPQSRVGDPVVEPLPTLRQPIPGSEHGPVRRIEVGA
jgi:hypothetical protein